MVDRGVKYSIVLHYYNVSIFGESELYLSVIETFTCAQITFPKTILSINFSVKSVKA